ncbi:Uncharacterised protein [Pasteurella multocida]|nr:Uncharacterised protein [Pasteurella multocida]
MYNIYSNNAYQNTEVYAAFAANEDASKAVYSSRLSKQSIKNSNHPPKNEYTESECLALSLGYVEVASINAYRGRYFIKNGKKWIHNIEALRKKLNAEYGRYIDDEELEAPAPEGFGYDVIAYYIYNAQKNSLLRTNEFKSLMQKIHIN